MQKSLNLKKRPETLKSNVKEFETIIQKPKSKFLNMLNKKARARSMNKGGLGGGFRPMSASAKYYLILISKFYLGIFLRERNPWRVKILKDQ